MDWRDAERERQRKRRIARLVEILGGLLIVLALWKLIDKQLELRNGVMTRGTVIATHHVGVGRRQGDVPEVQFLDRAGKSHGFIDESAGEYRVGQTVNVVYDAARPSRASVESAFENWKFPIFVGGFGALLLTIGAFGVRRRKG